ncbi:DUF721 domain-containing protein [Timonella sp. A28]|uniref:DUF721 domain-containing protein n=1 Tax=Timonella sp. A28 TaxID=3442640 RepID=UPI003EBBDEC9
MNSHDATPLHDEHTDAFKNTEGYMYGRPVFEILGLNTAGEVAREALNRAKSAARARGLYPGKSTTRATPELTYSASGKSTRDPKMLSDALGTLLAQRGWNKDVAVGGVIGRWPAIVGEDISSHCTAELFENGVLTVRAHSTAWATQLKFLTPELMNVISREIGEGVVLEIRILPPDMPSFSRGKFSVKGRGARDTWG